MLQIDETTQDSVLHIAGCRPHKTIISHLKQTQMLNSINGRSFSVTVPLARSQVSRD